MIVPATGKAFAVPFEELVRWDPSSFHKIKWRWPSKAMKPIGSFLRPRTEKVDLTTCTFAELQPITIHFDGSIDRRKVDQGRAYTMDLFFAHPGDIIVAKIDLKNGAVGIVPDWNNVAVTNHFAVYEPDRKMIIPEYFHRLIQTSFFKEHLWRNKVGAEGRKEVKLDFFKDQLVPVPPIEMQSMIVDFWHKAESAVDTAQSGLDDLVNDLNNRLLELYRKESSRDVIHSRNFALDFKDLAAWDVKSGRAAAFRKACPSFRPMGDFIEEATELVRPFDEPKKDWPVYGVNNKEGVFLNSHQKGDTFNAAYKRIRKDWFFHNPTRCNVGSLGIVPDVPEDAITSSEYQVWRVKENVPDSIIPGFVAVLIQTPFFIDLVQFNRVGAVKQRMYIENLCQLRIPYLPEAEQYEYAQAREKALADITIAQSRLAEARTDVEAMILGTKKVKADVDQGLSLAHRRAYMKLPLAERRKRLAEQAEQVAEHYDQESERIEREAWQGGDIVES